MMARHSVRRWSLDSGLLLILPTLLALILLLVVLPPHPAAAASSWASVPITANFTENGQPHIDGDHVVWRAYDGTDWEIMLYDLSGNTTRQLTHDGIDEAEPRVDGDHVLWITHPGGGAAVLVLSDLTGETSKLIPQSEEVQGSPDIKGDLVVWQAGDTTSSGTYVYNIGSDTTLRLTEAGEQAESSPLTDGRYVVFEAGQPRVSIEGTGPNPPAPEIVLYIYDTQTDTMDRLAVDVTEHFPQIAWGLVVWQQGADQAAEIVMYDAATKSVARVTNNDVEDVAAVVGGGKIAWLSWGRPDNMRLPHDSPWKVMLHDLATGSTRVVSENGLSVAMQEDGQLLVWSYWSMGPEYMVYDVSAGDSSRLSSGGLANFEADLDGGRVVWVAYPGFRLQDDRTIYLGARDGLPPAATAPTPPIREFVDIADSLYAPAIEQLARLGIARGYRTYIPIWSVDIYELQFRPEQSALRSQFLKMLLSVAGIDPRNFTNEPPFLDVQAAEATPDFTIRYYVEAGLENGIIQGISSRLFAPYSPLTRAQAVTMTVRAAKVVNPEAFDWLVGPAHPGPAVHFQGSLGDFSSVHGENMRVAEANGLLEGIVGFGSGWDPWAPMTRGEAAQLLVNLAGKL